jgi:hypothetical protein
MSLERSLVGEEGQEVEAGVERSEARESGTKTKTRKARRRRLMMRWGGGEGLTQHLLRPAALLFVTRPA